MRSLWVGNCNSEYMVDRLDELDPRELEGTPVVATRMVWLLREGDALVMPQAADPAYVAYVGDLMGFDADRVDLLAPQDNSARMLSQEALHHPGPLDRLKKLVAVPEQWQLRAYLADRGTAALARALELPHGTVRPFDAEGGAELFNSKVVFRAMAAALGVPVPDGALCATSGDLERALDRLAAPTGAVILKTDRSGGGAGNLLCLTDPHLPPAGAMRTLPLTAPQERAAILAHTGLTPTHAPRGQIVAESYHPHCRSLCLEIHCPPPQAGPPTLLSIGEMLMEPIWNGFIMPAPHLTPAVHDTLLAHALRLASGMRDFGYHGLVNIDAILVPDGQVWFNEVNARLGGCTHLYHLATTLLGPDWQRDHVLLARNDLPTAHMPALLDALNRHGLAFDTATGQGVVITGDDTALSGTAEYAVLAPDLDTARTLEQRLRTLPQTY
ncbi:preATP grasp domain-containing protein [Streptomyces sp. NPDC054961]